jgi:hypothetical protein
LPDCDSDDIDQEARVGFMKAVRWYRGGRGSSFRTFAELCVSHQLAGAITTARRAKHQPLNEAARGDQADRRLAAVPDREDPLDQLVTRDRLDDLVRQAGRLSERSAAHSPTPSQAGRAGRPPGGSDCRAAAPTTPCSGRGLPVLRGDWLLAGFGHQRLGGLGVRLFFRRQLRLDGRRLGHLCRA